MPIAIILASAAVFLLLFIGGSKIFGAKNARKAPQKPATGVPRPLRKPTVPAAATEAPATPSATPQKDVAGLKQVSAAPQQARGVAGSAAVTEAPPTPSATPQKDVAGLKPVSAAPQQARGVTVSVAGGNVAHPSVTKLREEVAGLRQAHVTELVSDVAEFTRIKTALEGSIAVLLAQQSEIEASVAEMGHEMEDLRKAKLSEMEESIAAQKEIALNKIMSWSEEEKSRLQTRLDKEYVEQAAGFRRQLLEKVNAEFDNIHDYFIAFASEKSAIAESDIRNFLAERHSMIVSGLK